MKRLFCSFLLILLTAAPAYASIQPGQWKYYQEVSSSKEGFVLISTDKDLLEKAQRGFSDLRLTDDEGREIPYQAVREEPPREYIYTPLLIDVVTRDNSSSLTLDLSKTGILHNEISLDIENSEDYLRDVTVEGSNDNSSWSLIKKEKLFCVSPDFKKSKLSYNPVSFRYLRLTVDCSGNKPLRITGASVKYVQPVNSTITKTIPANQQPPWNDAKTKTTAIIIDLGTKGYQIDHIDLKTNSPNFYRRVEIYESDNAKEWSLLTSDRICDYQWPGYQACSNSISVHRNTGRYLKAVISNQDSPPLDVRAEVYGETPKLLANLTAGNYKLWYGNPRAGQPQYDLGQFSGMIDKIGLDNISPGPEQINPDYKEKISPENSKHLLNATVIIAALVIGFIILKNLRSKPIQ